MKEESSVQSRLCEQLGVTDASLGFLLILIASVLLSFWSVVIQRKGLCLTIQGHEEKAEALPLVYPIKIKASAMVVGALGFFLCLALHTLEETEAGTDSIAQRSARTNLWASLFVLVAGILRFNDLNFVEHCQKALAGEDTLPD